LGSRYLLFPKPSLIAGSINVLGRAIPAYDFLLVGLGLGIGIFLILLFFKTPTGVLTRAYQFDERIAAAMGVDTGRLSLIMFALGSFLAGLGGSLNALVGTVEFSYLEKSNTRSIYCCNHRRTGKFSWCINRCLSYWHNRISCYFLFARFGPWISWIAIYTVFVIVLIFRPKGILVEGFRKFTKKFPQLILWFILAAFLLLLPTFLPLYYLIHSIDVIIIILFAVSFNLLYGYMKEISFGHAGFFWIRCIYNGCPNKIHTS